MTTKELELAMIELCKLELTEEECVSASRGWQKLKPRKERLHALNILALQKTMGNTPPGASSRDKLCPAYTERLKSISPFLKGYVHCKRFQRNKEYPH